MHSANQDYDFACETICVFRKSGMSNVSPAFAALIDILLKTFNSILFPDVTKIIISTFFTNDAIDRGRTIIQARDFDDLTHH